MIATRPNNIDEYIATFPADVQKTLQEIRAVIKKAVPGGVEAIKYVMPTFMLNGKNLVHFAAFKNHIGLYPAPAGMKKFEKELSVYKSGRGSVQFPLDKPMPLDLIIKIVQYNVDKVVKQKLQTSKGRK